MIDRTYIKDWQGRIIGRLDLDTSNGNKTISTFSGEILGRYDKRTDTTRDFAGRVIAKGDCLTMLLK